MKKLLSLLLALTLVMGLCSVGVTAQAASFTDVSSNAWYAQAVDYVVENGLFQGSSASRFSPGQPMDRGMFVTVLGRLAAVDTKQYTKSYFADVPAPSVVYYSPYVQWAASYEIVKGSGEFQFSPAKPVERQQIATFLYRFAEATDSDLSSNPSVLNDFTDVGDIAGYAKTAMEWAVSHKIIKGSGGKLNPTNSATRAEVAQIFYNLSSADFLLFTEIGREPIELKEPPVKKPVQGLTQFTKSVAGVSVRGVTFQPSQGYTADVVLGNDRLYSWEPSSSIVKRTGADVAVNGAFFQAYSSKPKFLTIYSSIVKDGVPLRLDNAHAPYQPAFVVDTAGKASIEYFKTIQNVELWQDGAKKDTLKEVGTNLPIAEGDATPMIYTSVFGSKVEGSVVRAVEADASGKVTKVYENGGSDLPIPKSGFLLVERQLRWAGETFVRSCKVGDELKRSVSYEGSKTQNIATAVSTGPCVVKNGKKYGSKTTYNQEGFTDPAVISQGRNRMAIGVTKDGTVVIASITANVTLQKLSDIMLGLGCVDAMNLDGGGSTNLYVDGTWIAGPTSRNMSNMIIFKAQ